MRPNEMPTTAAGVAGACRKPGGASLRREILLALAIKCALLYALWWAFFAQAPGKQAIAEDVARLWSAAAPGPTVSQPSKETQP